MSEPKKAVFSGESSPFAEITKERLISELFSAKDLARKTEIQEPFNQSALELITFHFSDNKGKHEMVPGDIMLNRKTPSPGDYLRAFIWFLKNNWISHARMSRAEYITALQGAQEQEDQQLKKQRQMESVIGI